MSFKSNGTKRDSRKVLSGVFMFVMFILCLISFAVMGFSYVRLIFAGVALYMSLAFYRLSNEV